MNRSPNVSLPPALHGIRVIDASSYLSGPFAGLMLADLGADVIKVEHPTAQDPLRRYRNQSHPAAAMAVNVNRNKSSVLLDLKADNDKAIFADLLAAADVLVLNMRPSAADGIGLGDETLAGLNERLIRLWITGYGTEGPLCNEPAYDASIQAYSGLIYAQSEAGVPSPIRTYVADKVASLFAVQGVLAALLERERTGKGQRVDVAMLDATSYFAFPDLFEDHTFVDYESTGGTMGHAAVVGRTKDGAIVLATGNGTQLRAALEVLGHPEWWEDLKRASGPEKRTMSMRTMFEPILQTATTDEWMARFRAADVPVAPILTAAQHLQDAQVVANELYSTYPHPQFGLTRAVRYPVRFGAMSKVEATPCRQPGDDQERLEALRATGRPSR